MGIGARGCQKPTSPVELLLLDDDEVASLDVDVLDVEASLEAELVASNVLASLLDALEVDSPSTSFEFEFEFPPHAASHTARLSRTASCRCR